MANGSWLPWWPKSWNPFSRSKLQSYDYDSRLASLAEDIETVELTLIDIKVRKRRAVSKVLQVMLTTWVAVLALLWGYASLMHSSGHADWAWSRSMFLVGLVVGTPILLVVLHRVISLWFRRMEKAQEAHLQALRKQRRDTINEIKKVTDFEHLRQLLNRYDTENPVAETEPYTPNASQSREALGLEKGLRNKLSLTSLRAKPSKEKLRRSQTTTPRSSRAAREEPPNRSNLAPAIVGMPISGVPSAPAPRGWMDKVADVILGTDPFGATPEDQQYALICRSCFHHNGLVPKNEFSEIQYICPHCNAFNSRRPSSKPVSSPFKPDNGGRFSPIDASATEDEDSGAVTTERRARPSSFHAGSVAQLPWNTPAKESAESSEGTQRRSARLRTATRANESHDTDESMQVDE